VADNPFSKLKAALADNWRSRARPSQIPPQGDWSGWLVLSGRGFGKTWLLTNYASELAMQGAGIRLAMVAPTSADTRDVLVTGPAGVLQTAPAHFKPVYEPSKRLLTWPNGASALLISAEEPERLRGPQFHYALCDELAAWTNPQAVWDQLMFTLRLGNRPRWVACTTPKPIALLKNLLARSDVHVTRGSSYENADNLPQAYLDELKSKYENTRLGRQEVHAELLEDFENSLFPREVLEAARYSGPVPLMKRTVVAIDPAMSAKAQSDMTGIVAAGLGQDGHVYVLADISGQYQPNQWARRALDLFDRLNADKIVCETNQGGELVRHTIHTERMLAPVKMIHASKGKVTRAEPVSSVFEQGKVRLVGNLQALEDELIAFCVGGYSGSGSPDRGDAMVYAISELMLFASPQAVFGTYSSSVPSYSTIVANQGKQNRFDGLITEGPLAGGFAVSR
jgi:predicted phage terminase large subunit-like protein